MACGKPVISTLSGAIPEVVGEAGILVPPYDCDALAEAMRMLLGDATRRTLLGEAAEDRARRMFSATQFAQRVFGLYQELVQ
jgi:glycosyltransferase involved in cell wall biosynthesis